MAKKVLILGDLHAPWGDLSVLKQAHEFNKTFKADKVISLGDLTDQKAFSRYPKEPEDDGPAVEWLKALKQLKEVEKLFPKMVVLNSNHDRRIWKKASEGGVPKFMIRTIQDLIPMSGWEWHLGPDPYVYDGVAYMHGDEHPGAPVRKAEKLGMPIVQGHSHQASIEYSQLFNKKVWALEAGSTINPKGAGFNYAASMLSKVWVGYAFIDEDKIPHLVPKK